jgi:CRISPR/Cas system endoribonuclease Cas6 (RAMP superfamily)
VQNSRQYIEYIIVATSSVLEFRDLDEQLVEIVVADLIGERRDQGFGFLGRFAT